MYRVLLTILTFFIYVSTSAQIAFTNSSFLFNSASVRSGVAIGVADINGDGLDDIVRLHNASDLLIEYQRADGGQFTQDYYGNAGPSKEWGMCIADVDEDGDRDIMVGGPYNKLKVFLTDSVGVDSVYFMPSPDIFLQAANFADINNDGEVDLFACHDDGVASAYRNMGNNNWMYDLSLINTASTNPSDNSGNYGSVWTDYDSDGDLDLYISKCRGGVSDPTDGRRTNLLFENDGSNNYSEVAASVGLQPGAQSWATDFADIDNDGDLDAFIVNHDSVSQLYENVNNMFVNITVDAGMFDLLDSWNTGIQSVFDDFDNDTYVDLIVTGDNGHYMFHNNGDNTFTSIDAFPAGTPGIHSLGVGDLNNDGFLDILGAFANGFNTPSPTTADRIFTNDGNDNNWLKVQLEGTTSNRDGIGARLEIYGGWGKQIREIRGGEGYGIVTSLEAHFGLGVNTNIDSLVVLWPSGIREVFVNPTINSTLDIIEDFCTNNATTTELDETICEGESYDFFGTELSIAGSYEEIGVGPNGCQHTTTLDLTVTDLDITLSQTGNTLTAAADLSYLWIDCGNGNMQIVGENEQSFTPTVDGSYAVVVTDENCLDTSACVNIVGTATFEEIFPFSVDVFPNPAKDHLNIGFGRSLEQAEIRIQTLHGATIYKKMIDGLQDVQLDISEFPAGNYFLEIRFDGRMGVMQWIKQ